MCIALETHSESKGHDRRVPIILWFSHSGAMQGRVCSVLEHLVSHKSGQAYDDEVAKLVSSMLLPGLPFGCLVCLTLSLQVASNTWVKDAISNGTVY